jgi:raffinose/stachyose/melibiose transport system substrate-binding protein
MKEAWANYEDGQAPYLLLVDFRYGEPLGTAVLGTEVQKMFLGQVDAAGAAAALQTGISQWFTPGE